MSDRIATPGHRSDPVTSAGFTMVELVIVMVVAGLVLAISMPKVDVPERRLTSAVRESWAELVRARQQAVLLQHDVVVEFDTAAASLRLLYDADGDGVADADERTEGYELPDGVVFGRASAAVGPPGASAVSYRIPNGETLPRLTFHRNGSASEWGGFYLRTTRATTPNRKDEVRALTVERTTGAVSGYQPSGNSWMRSF